MAYYSQPLPNNLGLALSLWNDFRNGGGHDQQAAALQGQKNQNAISGTNAAATQQAWQDQQAARGANEDATNTLLNPPVTQPVFKPGNPVTDVLPALSHMVAPAPPVTPPSQMKFYSEFGDDNDSRKAALAPFMKVPANVRADTYDAWVSQQTGKLPPIKYPSNFGQVPGMAAGDAPPVTPNGFRIPDYSGDLKDYKPFGDRTTVSMDFKDGKYQPILKAAPLGPDQVHLLDEHPEAVISHFGPYQRELAKQYTDYRNSRIDYYGKQVAGNPDLSTWLGGGEHEGLGALKQKAEGIIRPHLLTDKAGNIQYDGNGRPMINPKNPLTGEDAISLIYTKGSVDNPRMAVRDNEFDRESRAQGIIPKIKAEMASKTGSGNFLSPELTGDIWNLMQNTGATARERAYQNLGGIEDNANREGIGLDRFFADKAGREDYGDWKDANLKLNGPAMRDHAAAMSSLKPGSIYHIGNQKFQTPGGEPQKSPNAPAPLLDLSGTNVSMPWADKLYRPGKPAAPRGAEFLPPLISDEQRFGLPPYIQRPR